MQLSKSNHFFFILNQTTLDKQSMLCMPCDWANAQIAPHETVGTTIHYVYYFYQFNYLFLLSCFIPLNLQTLIFEVLSPSKNSLFIRRYDLMSSQFPKKIGSLLHIPFLFCWKLERTLRFECIYLVFPNFVKIVAVCQRLGYCSFSCYLVE